MGGLAVNKVQAGLFEGVRRSVIENHNLSN